MVLLLVKRIGFMIFTMIVVSIILFLLLETGLTGDPATRVLGNFATAEQKELWRDQQGYNQPVIVRYAKWLGNFATGELGTSIRYKGPVKEVLLPRLWNTAILGFWTFAIMIPLSLVLGVLSGMKEGSLLDRTISVFGILTTSVPEFASAVFFSALFVFGLKWLPGTSSMASGFEFKQLLLPAMVLVVYDFGYVARMTRASMAEVMTSQYVRSAVLKGLPYRQVIIRHALRNALIAPFTVIMLQINWLLSGVIVVEFFFAYKGFGALLLEASLNNDIALLEACAMIAVVVAVGSQTLADIGYTFLNPRIRFT
ncbi:MAG: ABC transporter permease [Desulfobacula sp.]|jgi:peptide/nickel transport system permease protein|uniref:ABC transporter permease n=1 Tax=Desulfobacula sp. TaxID=2593537 RepID=UPI001D4EDD79|nr:ABC transporter permease [Desulfobacula sp.]MBT3806610.1 ABC transporter permease [Desulfobacula sp.]MBT4027072.1 ABC transporter permease [Desulfobacula sp.]MBT4200838.1 ABC transporter permease [Desulfobacula sp.]MBT4508731.1 ABC transporter permease [Desulfobacula sp.]